MADTISKERRSRNMSRIRSKDMKPEMTVRKLVHDMGYRYRLHKKDLPGKPDLVFGPKKKVIFVHGCFWHQHGDPGCPITCIPKSNIDYWGPKLERNVQRDKKNQKKLEELGWKVLTVWECETKDKNNLRRTLKNFLNQETAASRQRSRLKT